MIESEVPEGEQIEFKESLPAQGASVDPWMSGEDRIGNAAKQKILEEVVAFGNAYGGTLLLGIRESDTKPAVAAEISPVQRCAELADRLKLVFRDCVEPQLTRIEIFALPMRTEDDGGVVVFRVGRSRLAPHRITTTLVCPIRRQDRCEKMTMREIQDMTLNVSRGLERLEQRFTERAENFRQEFQRLETPEDAWGIRLTAVPVGDDIRIDHVFVQGELVPKFNGPWHTVHRRGGDQRPLDGLWQLGLPEQWRPRLRAARADYHANSTGNVSMNSYREIHCDGLVELGLVAVRKDSREEQSSPNPLWPHWPIDMFANLAVWADRVRVQAGALAVEYFIEVELCSNGGASKVYRPGILASPDLSPEFKEGSTIFPRYSLGNIDDIPHLLGFFCRDFWNSLEEEIHDQMCIFDIRPAEFN